MAGEADRFLVRLRAGDTDYLRGILRAHQPVLAALAGIFVDPDQVTDIVHAAWLDWIGDLETMAADRDMAPAFVGRTLERAKARANRDGRTVDLAALAAAEPDEPVLPDARFDPDQSWHTPMKSWDGIHGTDVYNGNSLWDHIEAAIGTLTLPQQAVVILRDIEGLPADSTTALLGMDAKLQATLLHRAHARLRRAIEHQIGE